MEADAWIVQADETGDEAFFQSHADVTLFRDELLKAFPTEGERSQWAMPPSGNDRLLGLFVRWDQDPKVLLRIVELAGQLGLVVFDPQGPDVHSPAGVPREPKPASAGSSRMPTLVIGSAVGLMLLWLPLGLLASQAAPR